MSLRIGRATLCAAVLTLCCFPQVGPAQQTLTTAVVTGAIGCVPSNNNTGHMVCAEYTSAGAVVGVSWQAPPAPKASEAAGSVRSVAVNALAGQPIGVPGCGPANDGNGAATCLLMSKTSSGFALQAVSFYPPINLSTPLQTLPANLPLTTTLGNPGCANSGGGSNSVVVCALIVNNQVNAIAFRPGYALPAPSTFNQPALSSPLTPLAGLTGVTGTPSCVNVGGTTVACAIRQGQGLTGFALQFTAGSGGAGSIALTASMALPAAPFTSDPSCAPAATHTALNCGIVSGNNLLGISFDVPAHTAQNTYRSLGPPPGTETWTGKLGCSSFRTVGAQNPHLTGCAVISSAGNLFRITFDPQAGTQLGPSGPFAANINSSPSCLELFTDMDEMYCGETLASGAAVGSRLPVGLLSPAASTVVTSVLFDPN